MTYLKDFTVKAEDSTSVDAFSRWRTSGVSNALNSKNLFDNTSLYWDADNIVLAVTPVGNGNIDVFGSLTWVELS
jgi:hypothetical protein